MKISPARTAAFDILLRVENERAFTSVLLPAYEEKLAAPDRRLCHELVLGTLRRQIWLDRVIDNLARGKKLDVEVRIALRLGLYQLKFLDKVPSHAAINESVTLVQRARKTSAKGFVNAILRRQVKEPVDLRYPGETDRISVETSTPTWLVEEWMSDLGAEQAEAIAKANNEVGPTAFRLIDETDPENSKWLEASRPSAFVDGCYLLLQKPAAGNPALIYFQDEASQMVAKSIDVPQGGRFLDVCAAPGGKTGLIASRNAGSEVFAGDLYWPRIEFLRENLRQQRAEAVDVTQYDAEKGLPFADSTFDAVLVDAPCSGTGTIRRNPEIRYFLRPDDVGALAAKQLGILTNASKLVMPGGTLTYSTCSLEREENEGVCQRFLAATTEFRVVRPKVDERFITHDGFARTFPHRDDMDGFFIASFRRSPS